MSDESNNVADKEVVDSDSGALGVSGALGDEHAVADIAGEDIAGEEDLTEEKKPADDSLLESVAEEVDEPEVVADSSPVEAGSDEESAGESSEEGSREEVVARDGADAQESQEPEEDPATKKSWYILKVQSNRERSIAEALRRKIAIEGLEEYFGDVIVPTEKVTEFKGGKKKVVERKLYPGYIVVSMCINDDTWFAVRETSGIGDFTGSGGKPTPMLAHEVARIVHEEEKEHDESPKLDIRFKIKDRVKIKEGTFEGFEGDVHDIDEASGRVTVMINIFSRSTPVELEYWQIESV